VQVVTLLWNWWLERNRVREGERRMEPVHLACIARKTSDEFLAIGSQRPVSAARRMRRWVRPTEDVLKINSDGAYRSETSTGGWGFVIRDCDGQVIKAGAGQCPHLLEALHAELLACLAGVRAAGELGMSKVIIETDSMLARLALESNSFALALTGGVVYEIKSLMNLFFTSVVVSFCPRECNKVAHAVAALGCKCPQDIVLSWDGVPFGAEESLRL
jgi:hypothetical protein